MRGCQPPPLPLPLPLPPLSIPLDGLVPVEVGAWLTTGALGRAGATVWIGAETTVRTGAVLTLCTGRLPESALDDEPVLGVDAATRVWAVDVGWLATTLWCTTGWWTTACDVVGARCRISTCPGRRVARGLADAAACVPGLTDGIGTTAGAIGAASAWMVTR